MKGKYIKIGVAIWIALVILVIVLRAGDDPGKSRSGDSPTQGSKQQDEDRLDELGNTEGEKDEETEPEKPLSPAEKIVDIRTVDWDDAAGVAEHAYAACELIPALDLRRYPQQRKLLAPLVSQTLLADFDRLIREQSGGLPPRPPKTKVMTISLRNDDQSGARIASCTVDRWTSKNDVRHMYVDMEFSPTEPIVVQQQSGINY